MIDYLASPEVILLLVAVAIILIESSFERLSLRGLQVVAMTGVAVAFGATFCPGADILESLAGSGEFVIYARDELAIFFHRIFILSLFFILWMSGDYVRTMPMARREFFALPILATVGMMLLAAATDWTLVFVGLEIVTITFYILVAYQRNQPGSLEASVKYLIIGALSTGVLVFGIAFLFGVTRSTQLDALAFYLADGGVESATLHMAMVLVLAGVGFKLAAVPFHGWAPDVYQGAPTPVTGFLATASKAAGLVLLIRVFYLSGFGVDQLSEPLTKVISLIAGASLVLGSLAAIPQTNVKRLLGYSSITHAGFLLLAMSCCQNGHIRGLEAALVYILLYVPAALLAFFILSAASRQFPGAEIRTLSGLGRRSPVLAFGMLCALISMAGIPPLAGFVGKFAVLAAAWESGAYLLFALGVMAAVAGVYYYLGVVKAMYWDAAPEGREPFEPSPGTRLAVMLLSGFLLLLGFWPAPLGALVGWVFPVV